VGIQYSARTPSRLLHRPYRRTAAVAGLVLATLWLSACQGGGSTEAVLPDDGPPIQFSQAASGSFLRKLLAAGEEAAADGQVELNLSQAEATSFLSFSAQLTQGVSVQDLDPEMRGALQGIYGVEDLGDLVNSPQPGEPAIVGRLRGLLTSQADGGTPLNLSSLRPRLLEPQVYFKGDGRVIIRGYGGLLGWRIPARLVFSPQVDGGLRLDFQEGQLGRIPLPVGILNWAGRMLSRTIPDDLNLASVTDVRVTEGQIFLAGHIRQ
jgi:hypothetical protein